ncbi:Tubulin Hypothetical protein cofactor A [Nesidiocoris tenuis]|uniref:Programmed cell death protein 7 n=1 Tax=Nesidiocoris tenuis TaxID=355587 RepID=A0ABN7A7K8_9HEMI|nr:Tubulin Hypothetical protein cofactor A [Nesidiocoris tenuis]
MSISPTASQYFNAPPSNTTCTKLSQADATNVTSDSSALISKYQPIKRTPKTRLNVSTVRVLLSNYRHLALSVERLSSYLEVTKKTLSEEAWNLKYEELEGKMNLLLESKQQIEDPNFISLVHRSVGSARKKRKLLSRKKQEWRKFKEKMPDFRREKHKRIDLWLERMQDQVERAQREEIVKKEADLVLSDVYMKRHEGKRILGLLNSLKKLRNAKALQRESSQQPITREIASSTEKVIDNLKDMWTAQMNEYSKEEEGLKVMMNDAAVKRVNNEEKSWKSTLNSWTVTMLGSSFLADPLQVSPADGELFFRVRREWDQFTTDRVSLLSSCIPSGYVVPAEPSSDSWADFAAELA